MNGRYFATGLVARNIFWQTRLSNLRQRTCFSMVLHRQLDEPLGKQIDDTLYVINGTKSWRVLQVFVQER